MNSTTPRPGNRRSRKVIALLAPALLVLATACSSSSNSSEKSPTTPPPSAASGPAAAPPATGQVVLTIAQFDFSPKPLTVSPGTVVTVVNKDDTNHTVTATQDKVFNTGTIEGGATATFTAPATPGTYDYLCTFHQFMTGTLIVQ